jgi:hypothetical protein
MVCSAQQCVGLTHATTWLMMKREVEPRQIESKVMGWGMILKMIRDKKVT